ncbi:MAG: DUF1887 family CARF protein [Candidatus Marinimicrobia bacterium]|nr:DUF1887 family CARF protein [Candidatus Neomarinimicrobiota bacterium]
MPLLEVCLLDDSPINGFLGLVLKKPDAVVWLRTPRQKNIAKQIETAVATYTTPTFETREILSDDVDSFIKLCQGIFNDYPEHEILLNVTGGDRLQAILATDIFRKANKKVFYIDTHHSKIVNIGLGESKYYQIALTVNEYIALQGIKMTSGIRFDPEIGKRSPLTYFIAVNMDNVMPFIDKIRDEWIKMGNVKQNANWDYDDGRIKFLIDYEAEHDRMKFKFGGSVSQKIIEVFTNPDEYLLNGGWLREMVFLRVHKSQYDDVRLDVRLDKESLPEGYKNENLIDIALMKGSSLYIFQCFSYPITHDSFTELKAFQQTTKLLNAKGFVFVSHKIYHGFIERARELGVSVVVGRRVPIFSL